MKKPQKARLGAWRGVGLGLVCTVALAGTLCLGGCSLDDLGDAGKSAVDQLAAGVAEVDEALDALDVEGWSSDGTAETVSRGLRHEVSCELTPATVERVVDGDTLKVQIDGESVRVRFIGINTPESVAPEEERNTEEGVDASAFLKDYLWPGDDIWLMFDTEPYDQYDRMLAYVWTEVPEDFADPDEVRTKMVNGFMADQGYAVVHAYHPNDAYCDLFHDFADDAEACGRGLWEISDSWADGI